MSKANSDSGDSPREGLTDVEIAVLLAADEWTDGSPAAVHINVSAFVEKFLAVDDGLTQSTVAIMQAIRRLDEIGLFCLLDSTRESGLGSMMAGFRVSDVGRLTASEIRKGVASLESGASWIRVDLGEHFADGLAVDPTLDSDSEQLKGLAKRRSAVVAVLLMLTLEERWIRVNLAAVLDALGRSQRLTLGRGGITDRWLTSVVGEMARFVPGLKRDMEGKRSVVAFDDGLVDLEFGCGDRVLTAAEVKQDLREAWGLGKLNPMATVVEFGGRIERGLDPGKQAATDNEGS